MTFKRFLYQICNCLLCCLPLFLAGQSSKSSYTRLVENTGISCNAKLEDALITFNPQAQTGRMVYASGGVINVLELSLIKDNDTYTYAEKGIIKSVALTDMIPGKKHRLLDSTVKLLKLSSGKLVAFVQGFTAEGKDRLPSVIQKETFDKNIYIPGEETGIRKVIYIFSSQDGGSNWKLETGLDPASITNGKAMMPEHLTPGTTIPGGFELNQVVEDGGGRLWMMAHYVDAETHKKVHLFFSSAGGKLSAWTDMMYLEESFHIQQPAHFSFSILADGSFYIFSRDDKNLGCFYSRPGFCGLAPEQIYNLGRGHELYMEKNAASWFTLSSLSLKKLFGVKPVTPGNDLAFAEWLSGDWRIRYCISSYQKKNVENLLTVTFSVTADELGNELPQWSNASIINMGGGIKKGTWPILAHSELKGSKFRGSVYTGLCVVKTKNKKTTQEIPAYTWMGAGGRNTTGYFQDALYTFTDNHTFISGSFGMSDSLGFFCIWKSGKCYHLGLLLPTEAPVVPVSISKKEKPRRSWEDVFEVPEKELFYHISIGGQNMKLSVTSLHTSGYQLTATTGRAYPVSFMAGYRFRNNLSLYAGLQVMNYSYDIIMQNDSHKVEDQIAFTRAFQIPFYISYRLRLYKNRLWFYPFAGVALLRFNEATSPNYYINGSSTGVKGKEYLYQNASTRKYPWQARVGATLELRAYKKLGIFAEGEYILPLNNHMETLVSDDYTQRTVNPQYQIINTLGGFRFSLGIRMYPRSNASSLYFH